MTDASKLLAFLRRLIAKLCAAPADDTAARMEAVRRDLERKLREGGHG